MPSIHTTRWLGALLDPAGPNEPPRRPLTAAGIESLCRFADAHSILPVVTANLHRLADAAGARRVIKTNGNPQGPDALTAALEWARRRLAERTALALMVRRQLDRIATAAARRGVPMAQLKGGEFADRLYDSPSLRTFSDLDLIVSTDALDQTEAVMSDLGYTAVSLPNLKHDGDYGERCWRPAESDGGSATVEVHWNLVNSPALRTGVSVQYEDLQFDGDGHTSGLNTTTPASLLLVAAVHGATGHQFDRLGLLCDLLCAARGAAGPLDEDYLKEAIRHTGCAAAMSMGLHLCERFFGERGQACKELQRRLGLAAPSIAARLLVTPGVVLGVRTPLVRARRLAFRQGLKKPQSIRIGGART